MRIKTIITFIDKLAKDPADAEVPAGKELTVTAERGAELVGLRVAEEIPERSAPKAKPATKPKAKVQPTAVPPAPVPAPEPSKDPVPPAEPSAS